MLSAAAALFACTTGCGLVLDFAPGDADSGVQSDDASQSIDAPPRTDATPLDATRRDAPPSVDAASADARWPYDGTAGGDGSITARDGGGAPDATVSPDCGTLGGPCGSDGSCNSGERCSDGVCMPDRASTCGGFSGAECPPAYPACLWCIGCDFGYCLTAMEAACICGRSPGLLDCTMTMP